ncbi:hypothetical protein HAX54_036683 [Datura stramonium]|uniref:Uncharacterized protein n=1 Tax=Datura stramonium TaxID=4076 RepID=A0ABS8VK81_DATST|nr:hypothetical protein [Datura stramonium]
MRRSSGGGSRVWDDSSLANRRKGREEKWVAAIWVLFAGDEDEREERKRPVGSGERRGFTVVSGGEREMKGVNGEGEKRRGRAREDEKRGRERCNVEQFTCPSDRVALLYCSYCPIGSKCLGLCKVIGEDTKRFSISNFHIAMFVSNYAFSPTWTRISFSATNGVELVEALFGSCSLDRNGGNLVICILRNIVELFPLHERIDAFELFVGSHHNLRVNVKNDVPGVHINVFKFVLTPGFPNLPCNYTG